MFNRIKDWYDNEINRYGGLKQWYYLVRDKHARKGRHSQNYIHLFYIDPINYVGAHA